MTTSSELESSHTSEAIRLRFARGAGVSYLRDWIYGAIDGAVTTFAVAAAVAGADMPTMAVLVLGIANLVADGFAMAASNYSGTKAERDDYRRILEIEGRHIALVPEGEREEIRQLFAAKGFAGDDLERLVHVISCDPLLWAKTMAVEEYGLSPTPRSPTLAALSTFVAFILCGTIPLVTYLAFGGLGACVAGTSVVFFCVGAIKSHWSPISWWRSGFEILGVGMSAAALAFAIGHILKTVVHGTTG